MQRKLLKSDSILLTPNLIAQIFKEKGIQQLKVNGGFQFIAEQLRLNLKYGLSPSEVKLNQEMYELLKKKQTAWSMVVEQFEDKTLQILLAATLISLLIGLIQEGFPEGCYDSFGIFFALSLIIVISVANNLKKQEQFYQLFLKQKTRNVPVIRGGQNIQININELVVGDILEVQTGEILPVDGILISADDLIVDESDMTGESDPIYKSLDLDNYNPLLISGSKVLEGIGKIIVLQVGENSVQGKIKALQQTEQEQTPLQEKLSVMADDIGVFGLYAAIATFICMCVHLFYDCYQNDHAFISLKVFNSLIQFFMIAVSVLVMAIPEGLPLAVTLTLAYSSQKMYEEQNLVRWLSACETMGGVNNICSDKTGTLTQNDMSLQKILVQNLIHTNLKKENFSQETIELLSEAISFNSNANPTIEAGVFQSVGNKTECALLKFIFQIFKKDYRQIRNDRVIKVIPFNYKNKSMATFVKLNESQARMYVKGAPDYLLHKCINFIAEDQQIQQLDYEQKDKLSKANSKFAQSSLRNIILAYKDMDINNLDEQIKDLTFIALTGIKDPLRPNIPQAVEQCYKSGIKVRMVTGDNLETAIAIAKDAKILPQNYVQSNDSYQVMEGNKFQELVGGLNESKDSVQNLQAFDRIASELVVLARSTPEHKFILVTGLKQLKNVVAVTGDGTNDAPALKKADIGLAMGIAGTEVAKDSAGIILLDDNFSSILVAVKYGRNIFDCIRKFLQFQLTVNIVAVFMIFVNGLVSQNPPLTVIQILWINLIMDTLGSLALATEQPQDDLLNRDPYSRNEHLVTPLMWRNILCQSIYQIFILSIILFQGKNIFNIEDDRLHLTVFFNVFVFLQIFNMINARKLQKDQVNVLQGIFQNKFFIIVLAVIFISQIFIVQFGGKFFNCFPLNEFYMILSMIIGFGSIPISILIKEIPEELFNKISFFRTETSLISKKSLVEIIRKPNKSREYLRKKSSMGFREI